MAEPFENRPEQGRRMGSLRRGRRARAAAGREVEALLAGADRVADVSAEQVVEAAGKHGVDILREGQPACRELYRRYLEHCLRDQALSDSEAADVAHLRQILAMEDADAVKVHEEVACAVYGAAIDQVLADHRLEPEEETFLERLREDLRLEGDVAGRALAEGKERARRKYLSRVVSRSDVFVASRQADLRLDGTSESTIEEAVGAAIAEASAVLPRLREVEVKEIRAEVSNGQVSRWHVRLSATLGDGGPGGA